MKRLFEKIKVFLGDRFTGRNAKNFDVSDEIITLPNLVTICGIIWALQYVMLYLTGIINLFIPVLVILIVLTDMTDGWLADRFNQHSKYGKILDPMRDYVFTLALLGNIYTIVRWNEDAVLYLSMLIFYEVLLALLYLNQHLRYGKISYPHGMAKARFAFYWVLAFIILSQTYWFGVVYFSPIALVHYMSMASCLIFVYYALKKNSTTVR
jgi:phosphatidylglycerophosphate synthase